jgi:hypothetical protein
MGTPTQSRTPLHEMETDQLRFMAEDELTPPWKREIVEMLLGERSNPEIEKVSTLVERISAYHA